MKLQAKGALLAPEILATEEDIPPMRSPKG